MVCYHLPVYTADSVCTLRHGPPLEAHLVHVVAACRFAPDYFFGLWIKFHEADRAVTLDRFSLSRRILCGGVLLRTRGCSLENLAKFLGTIRP